MENYSGKQSVGTVLAILVTLFCVQFCHAQQKLPDIVKNSNHITVLRSTREELESVYGNPRATQTRIGSISKIVNYKFKDGQLEVSYAISRCASKKSAGFYDVKKDTVIKFEILLSQGVKKKALDTSSKGWSVYRDPESGAVIFTNEEIGIEYSGDDYNITSIRYFPATRYDSLRCSTTR